VTWDPQISGNPVPLDYSGGERDMAVFHFFNAVYAWMAVGLAVTAGVAWYVSTNAAMQHALYTPGALIGLFLAEIALVVVISSAVQKISASVATMLFVLYAALNGVMFSSIFMLYTRTSITGAFVSSAAMFGVMSLYGMFTKTDLTRMGKILIMALIGIIVASIINFFVASSALYWLISYVGVFLFAGLTAYDTQRLQAIAESTRGNAAMAARLSVSGALMLYLDFINMFLFMLRIFGSGRRN
jgi:FtsH-binding integral membrane protein